MLVRNFQSVSFFFFNDTATTEIYTLSLHDALPIYFAALGRQCGLGEVGSDYEFEALLEKRLLAGGRDRKSTRLNSSHSQISYAVFCLKKKRSKCTRRMEGHGSVNTPISCTGRDGKV